MSVGDWVAITGMALTLLGLVVGAAWWMSALHAQVKGTKAECHQLNGAIEKLTIALEHSFESISTKVERMGEQKAADHSELWRAITKLTSDLGELRDRMTREEARA